MITHFTALYLHFGKSKFDLMQDPFWLSGIKNLGYVELGNATWLSPVSVDDSLPEFNDWLSM